MAAIGTARRVTTRDLVVEHLRPLIMRGDLDAGAKLNVPEIAASLDVSHTPAREALQLLEAEGLVTSDPYRGARVAPLRYEDCEELYLMRTALEQLAARLGTAQIDHAGVARMEALMATMSSAAHAGDVDAFVTADWTFHEVHFGASGRDTLWQRILTLRRASERYTRLTYRKIPNRLVDNAALHEQLLEHVRARDALAAEAWVTDVLAGVSRSVRKLLADRID